MKVSPGLYKRYDGELVWVQGKVKHAETKEELVLYRMATTMETEVLPLSSFTEQVSPGKGKRKVQRFERVV